MNKEKITRQQSAAMRGIAILAIVLHNYCHWLPMVQENEYTFSEHNVRRLMMLLAHPDASVIAHLLSFFGHYGVPVFVMLSAYGLVMKYESRDDSGAFRIKTGVCDFISSHYMKLFLMMVTGYACFVLVDYMTPGPRHYDFWNVIGQLGMFSNLYVNPDHDIWPGPYWYFGLTAQIYIVYRLLLYPGQGSLTGRMDKRKADVLMVALAVASLLAQLLFQPEGLALQWYRYNIFGSFAVLVAAIMFTRSDRVGDYTRTQYAMACFMSLLFIFFFSIYEVTWIIVPFLVCIATVALVKCLPQSLMRPLAWVGSISAYMFVCHPIARKVLIPISRRGDVYSGLVLYLVATLILAILFRHLIGLVMKETKG